MPKPSIVSAYKRIACPDDTTKSYELPITQVGHGSILGGGVRVPQEIPSWKRVLELCGYPTTVIVVDFESYFDEEYGMGGKATSLSTIEYVQDARWEVLGCGFTTMKGTGPDEDYVANTIFQVGEEMVSTQLGCLKRKYGENLEGCTVVCQNANFDCMVLSRRYGIHPPFVIDLLGLLRHWESRIKNDLDSASEREDLIEKGDTEQFSGVTFRTRFAKAKTRGKGPKMPTQRPKATTDQIAALSKYGSNDCYREWELFTIMLPRLSNPQTELRIMQHHLELFTKPTLRCDYVEAERIIEAMQDAIADAIPYGVEREQISGDNSFEGLMSEALLQAGDDIGKYLKVMKSGMMLAIAKTDPERELLLKHPNDRVRNLMSARVAITSWPTHIKRVERIVRMAKCDGGRVPVPLKYHGAHTGRASGGEKINLQNLGSRGHELVNAIRNILVADSDSILVIVDEAQIEARVLAWIAQQADLIADFASGADTYCKFASKVTGFAVRKPKKSGGIPQIEKRMEQARSLGKVGVLGCGYGMGTTRIEEYANGAPYFCNIDTATAEKIKVAYREGNPRIVQFWKDIERAFAYTAKYKKSCVLRNLRFDTHPNADVVITLPNGRELKYGKVKVVPQERWNDTIEVWNGMERHWEHTWGGSLTENVVQAVSRDILMDSMLRLEDRGRHTGHHIHDELVLVVPKGEGQAALAEAIEEMSRRPAWAPDCPLAAEGVISERYGKH